MFPAWERSLVFGVAEDDAVDDVVGSSSALRASVQTMLEGRIGQALSSLPRLVVVCVRSGDASVLRTMLDSGDLSADPVGPDQDDNRDVSLVAAVGLLRAFQRENFTGPALSTEEVEEIGSCCEGRTREDVMTALELDGEDLASTVSHPEYLLAARTTLVKCADLLGQRRHTASLWAARVSRAHQGVLDGRSPALRDEVSSSYASFFAESKAPDSPVSLLHALAHIERSHAMADALDGTEARRSVDSACKELGILVKLTGALGVRTKWQQKPTASMIARVISTTGSAPPNSGDMRTPTGALEPRNVPLDDPDALGLVQLTAEPPDEEDEGLVLTRLRAIDQIVLLASAEAVIATNPGGELTNEEIRPYVSAVLDCTDPTPVSLQSQALLMRSRIEMGKGRYAERSMQQAEELVEFFRRGQPSDGSARLFGLEASGLPAHWQVQKELAILLGRLGLVKAATQVFEELGLWNEVIDCHRLMGNVAKARQLLQSRLEVDGERPRLLCAMGEVTRDEEWFVKAWTVSGQRYAKAKRLEGRLRVDKSEYAKAVSCFEDALAVNFLYPDAWFTLAHAAQKLGDYAKAANALTTCVQLDPSNAEAWNNLGSAQLSLGNARAAVSALKEAVKMKRDSWRVWENLQTASIASRSVPQLIQAMEALIDMLGRDGVSRRGIDLAVDEVIELGSREDEASRIQAGPLGRQLLKVLRRASSIVSTEPSIWDAYARLHGFVGNPTKEFDCRQKQLRAMMATVARRYTTVEDEFLAVARGTVQMADAAQRENDGNNLISTSLQLKSLITATEANFSGLPVFAELQTALEQLSPLID